MPRPAPFRDVMILLGLVTFGVSVVVTGMLVSSALRNMQLLRNGEASALHWMHGVEDKATELAKSFDTRRMLLPLEQVSMRLGGFSGPFRIELYDLNGDLIFSGGNAGLPALPADPPAGGWGAVDSAPKPLTRLYDESVGDKGFHYASVIVPFMHAGTIRGYVHVLVNLTAQATALTTSFRIIAGVTAFLVILTFGVCALIVGRKIHQHRSAQERIHYLSAHDELTGLANRAAFSENLTRALEHRRSHGGQVAVLIVDVEKFKELNDSKGHSAGDTVLRALAARLSGSIRDGDIVARHDGDEFAVALTGVDGAREAARLVERIAQGLREPYGIEGDLIEIDLSIGIAMAPADGDNTGSLLRHADLALTRAKRIGRNCVRFFDRGMDLTFLRRREREQDLRRALERDEFDVLYQPQVWLADGALYGHEALVRWRHPLHGMISPAYFISIAEECELIVPLGQWILRRACQDALAWPDPVKVAVNLSPVQFRTSIGIAEQIGGILDEVGFDPSRLEIEITENLLMWDTEAVLSGLTKLKDLGIVIAMDDFGTGYSSLSYLSRFPFGKIKIDRSFVHAMHADEAVNAIVGCIVALGRALDVTITGEGIETREQAELLRKLGCEQGQGFLWGRPVTAADTTEYTLNALRPRAKRITGKTVA